ncbi:helix-turn-helix domain-containing protein [Alkalihalobacillus macyae]|uniref:helix-turn-helix domain-containing protein n=1 Tax=Guptibacillus hwajinpoensis TaxID=208199 RepID=UPI00273B6083|nr:helix-turn-helix domain-containing protein [Alkalihalobacillus macyae]MDP4549814.1 helix-turn-helix domain-containing protein [Alkalihalobacillus macyae]
MYINSYADLKQFVSFESVEDMNKVIDQFKTKHKYDLNKSELALLTFLSQHSCKNPGVSYLKNSTICVAINKSESTVERCKRKLKALGVLSIKPTKKRHGGQGSNVYVINSTCLDQDDNVKMTTPYKAHTSTKATNKDLRQVREGKTHSELDFSYLPSISDDFAKEVLKFFPSPYTVYRYYGKVMQAHKQSKLECHVSDVMVESIHAFKSTIFKAKMATAHGTKPIRNITAYFYGTLKTAFSELRRKEVADRVKPIYDWSSLIER